MSPHTKGKEQAPVTLENTSGEKREQQQQQQKQCRERGGGGRKWQKEPRGLEKPSTVEN